jgi:hypothetical protein
MRAQLFVILGAMLGLEAVLCVVNEVSTAKRRRRGQGHAAAAAAIFTALFLSIVSLFFVSSLSLSIPLSSFLEGITP